MTVKRYDKHSTEFGLWLREQEEIDSGKGYLATNVDFMWKNWKTKQWMLIEEKRYNSDCKQWQVRMFNLLNKCAQCSQHFYGFHLLQFEKTSPEDGLMYLNKREITKKDLLDFLQFRKDKSWYAGWFTGDKL